MGNVISLPLTSSGSSNTSSDTPEYDAGTGTTTKTIDWSNSNFQKLTLAGNCTLTFSNVTNGESYSLRLIQDGTGNRSVTWPASMYFPSATPPTLSTTGEAQDLVSFLSNGTINLATYNLAYGPYVAANLKSLTLNGSNKGVSFGNTSSYDYTVAQSYSFWAKLGTLGGLLTKMSVAAGALGMEIYHNGSGTIDFGYFGNGTSVFVNIATPLSLGTWYHLAFTNSGSGTASGLKMYVNGAAVATTVGANTPSGSTLTTALFSLGCRNGTSAFAGGTYDEVTVWTAELTAGNVNTLYHGGAYSDPTLVSFAASLAHYYKLGDTGDTASTIIDHVGSANGTGINLVSGDFTTTVP